MKPKVHPDKQRQLRAERQRRGRGLGDDYVPYIQVGRAEFASRGRSHVVPSALFKRQHHVLSDLELHVLWMLQMETPMEILEQFPLQWQGSDDTFEDMAPFALGTIEVSEQLGVKHPAFGKNDPKRLTTDFVVRLKNGRWCAFHVKYQKELAEKRKRELRCIEQTYWGERGIPLRVVTEQDVNSQVIENLSMMMTYDRDSLQPITRNWIRDLVIFAEALPINEAMEMLRSEYGGDLHRHISTLKYSVVTGLIGLDMSVRQLMWTERWPEMTIKLG